MKKTKIIVACFLAVLTVVGAGYAYSLELSESKLHNSEKAYRTLTGEDAADAMDSLIVLFDAGQRWGFSSRELGQIISVSSRAASAVSYLGHGQMRYSGLYSLFGACEKAAFECLAGQGAVGILDELAVFVRKIKEMEADFSSDRLSEPLAELFASPEFETLMLRMGVSDFAADSDFHSMIGQETSKREAKKTAEKYLGRNYALKVSESSLAYTVYASNISATVSKHGGYLMQLMFDLPRQEITITEDEALKKMEKFLSDVLPEYDLLSCQGITFDGLYRGVFCPVRNGILCLDEEISVGVSASSGRICLFDAGEYYRSRGGEVRLPKDFLTAQAISEMWEGESVVPCKVRIGYGVETLCFRVGNFYADGVTGRRLDNIKNK